MIARLSDLIAAPVVWLAYKSKNLRLYLQARLPSSARVLEIGSGGNPWFRSNVLCDKYLSDNIERGDKPLVRDREFVQADATNLPFKDKEFDFVFCSHVAEHIGDIEAFFREIQRVGKAGYIETPNYFFEQTVGTATHDWALFVENGKLHAERKWMAGCPERAYHGMHAALHQHPLFHLAYVLIPELKVMRFWWKDRFDYEILAAPAPMQPTRAVEPLPVSV
jgi:hypothetical protein